MYCTRHPKIETNLRCGKCGELICPKCSIQTPVGARCPECARLTRLPVFQIPKKAYLKAVVIGIVTALLFGTVWGFIVPFMFGYGYLLVILGAYIISELINKALNHKRGKGLQIIAGGCTILSYVFAVAIGLYVNPFSLAALAIGVIFAFSRFN